MNKYEMIFLKNEKTPNYINNAKLTILLAEFKKSFLKYNKIKDNKELTNKLALHIITGEFSR